MSLRPGVARLALAWCVAWCLGWLFAWPAHAETAVRQIDRAVLEAPAGPQAVTLPHVLDPALFRPDGRSLRLRLTLDLPQAPADTLGIFIGKVSQAGRVRLNGHDLGSCGGAPLQQLRCLNQPLWLTAGPDLWRAGENVIEVEVWGTQMQLNGLSEVVVGPSAEVWRTHYLPRHLLQVTLVQALGWASLVLGVISLGVAVILRGQRLYLWFGLAAVLRGVGSLHPVMTTIWGDPFWNYWSFVSIRLMAAPLTILAMVVFFDRPMPRLERALAVYALAVPGLLALGQGEPLAVRWVGMPMLVLGAVLTAMAARWTWQARSQRGILLLAAALALIASGLHDLWRVASDEAFNRVMLLPFSHAVLMVAMGGLILRRITRALHTSQDLNAILARRVALHEADLERKHQTILELERKQARVQERERFLRDLHDGLGSSLSATRLRLDDQDLTLPQVQQMLDECIDDMRLLLATSAADGELADALADLRWRMDRRLAEGGPVLRWEVALDGMPALPATARLQLLRVLQEALANALRHAGAGTVTVRAGYEPGRRRLQLTVEDDGRGFTTVRLPGSPVGGRGLANMRYRASQLRASLDIDSDPAGTRVDLTWELPPQEALASSKR